MVLVTFTESCQDSTFQADKTFVIDSQDVAFNGFTEESTDCVYDVDLSENEDFLDLYESLFVNNRIIQKLTELYENDDRDGIEDYVFQVKGALYNMPDDVTRTTFESYLDSEIDDTETATYIVQTINTLVTFMENNATLFEIEQNELACIFASEFNNLHFGGDESYPRNACLNQCEQALQLCRSNAVTSGTAVVGAGIVGAWAIIGYGWWTGAAAGTAAVASITGGFIGGVFTLGAGHLNCSANYAYCVSLCSGGDDEEEGPLPFGDGW